MILTCIILKIKVKLKYLAHCKLWHALFILSDRLNFDKIRVFHKHLRSLCGGERKFAKKIYRSEFLQSSFIFVMYLLTEVYRKILSEAYCEQNSI